MYPQIWTRINKTQRMADREVAVEQSLFDSSLCLCLLHSVMFAQNSETYGMFSNVPHELLSYLLESLRIEWLLAPNFVADVIDV